MWFPLHRISTIGSRASIGRYRLWDLDNEKLRALILTHASERKLGHFYAMPEHLVVLKQLDFNGLEGVIQG